MERVINLEFPPDSTPLQDYSDLIPEWVQTMTDLNRIEAENILKVQRKYLRGSKENPIHWFHTGKLKSIHQSMFADVWSWAGKYRKSITSIGIRPALIPSQLAEFCHEARGWFETPTGFDHLEMAARIHHRLVFIHPFENGNGRFSRLISDRFLFCCNCEYPIWPADLNQDGKIRNEYIRSLKSADKGDLFPLIEFMKRFGAALRETR